MNKNSAHYITNLIFNRASLQSSNRYFALREYMRTTPSNNCPDNRRAIGGWSPPRIAPNSNERFYISRLTY